MLPEGFGLFGRGQSVTEPGDVAGMAIGADRLVVVRHKKTGTRHAIESCAAHTFPTIEVRHPTAHVEHEATTSRIGEDQLFYAMQRGISAEDAVSMIVNGFCREVFKELPMEFAVEAQKLLAVSLEGSVG